MLQTDFDLHRQVQEKKSEYFTNKVNKWHNFIELNNITSISNFPSSFENCEKNICKNKCSIYFTHNNYFCRKKIQNDII